MEKIFLSLSTNGYTNKLEKLLKKDRQQLLKLLDNEGNEKEKLISQQINFLFKLTLKKIEIYNYKDLNYIIATLLNTNLIDKEGIKLFNQFVKKTIEKNFSLKMLPILALWIKTNKLDNSLIKNLFYWSIEKGKEYFGWAKYVLPELVKTEKLEEKEIKLFNDFFKKVAIEKAKNYINIGRLETLPLLVNTGQIDKEGIILYNQLLKDLLQAKCLDFSYTGVINKFLKAKIVNKECINLFNQILENGLLSQKSSEVMKYMIPLFISTNKLNEKNLNKLLKIAILNLENDSNWIFLIPLLLHTGKIHKEGVSLLNDFFKLIVLNKFTTNIAYAEKVLPVLLKTDIIDDSGIQMLNDHFSVILENYLEGKKTFYNSDWWIFVVPSLIKTGKINTTNIQKLFKIALKESETYTDWARYVLPELVKTEKLGEEEIKLFNSFFKKVAIEKAKKDSTWAQYVLPALLKTNTIDKEGIRLFNNFFEKEILPKSKQHTDRARYVLPALIGTNKINKETINDLFIETLNNIDKYSYWIKYMLSALIKTGKIDKKRWYVLLNNYSALALFFKKRKIYRAYVWLILQNTH